MIPPKASKIAEVAAVKSANIKIKRTGSEDCMK